jgi:ABC-type transport system substrate-binding protein
MSSNYWTKVLNRRLTRRRAVTVTGALAGSAAFLAACGGDDDDDETPSAGGTTGATPSAATDTGPTEGGHLIWQGYGDPGGGLEMVKTWNPGVHQMASLILDPLWYFAYGLPDYPGIGNDVLPNLATSLPELTPDKLMATFSIQDGVTWQNGEPLTSEDVKWTYDTLAFADESAWRGRADFAWLESVETPDDTTVIFHLSEPNADILQSMAGKNVAGIMNQAQYESGAYESSILGSGPYEFVEYSPPTVMKYQRYPDHWNAGQDGYFDSIDRLGTSDSEKKVADIISGQVHVTYWFPAEERERVKDSRDDLLTFQYPRAGSGQIYMRTDIAPYNDKRVRQALSMGYDRQILIDNVTEGEGQPDQQLSRSGTAWGFRGPEDLPRADLYELNVNEAKKLMAAANVDLPIQADIPTWNATVIGQKYVDEIVLITTQWMTNGLVDATLLEETFGQYAPRFLGQYDTMKWGPNVTATLPDLGLNIRNKYYSGGETPTFPTPNESYVVDTQIDELVSAQLQEFDTEARKELFRELEDVLVEFMAHNSGVTGQLTYFIDPTVKNAQMPRDAYNGSTAWMRYWYFGNA